jgi:hypothetical protein
MSNDQIPAAKPNFYLAKVGVEGSNPFARSKNINDLSRSRLWCDCCEQPYGDQQAPI